MQWSTELRNVLNITWVSVTLSCKVSCRFVLALTASAGDNADQGSGKRRLQKGVCEDKSIAKISG